MMMIFLSMTRTTTMLMVIILLTTFIAASATESILSHLEDVVDSLEDADEDFVDVIKLPPNLQSKKKVVVNYYCQTDAVIVVDVMVMMFGGDGYDNVFSKAWKCRGQVHNGRSRWKQVRLRLPANIAFRPDFYNRQSDVIVSSRIRVAMVTEDEYTRARQSGQAPFLRGTCKHQWDIPSLPPYSRPSSSPPCPVWYRPILQRYVRLTESDLSCPKEPERMTLLDYPVVFNGATQGIVRPIPVYRNSVLEKDRIATFTRPMFTLEVWIYVIEYCPRHDLTLAQVCGVVVHATSNNAFLTPALLINVHGQIQVDVQSPSGYKGIKTQQVVPKNTWIRLVFSMNFRSWNLNVNYGPDLKEGFYVDYTYDEDIMYYDTQGYYYLGGLGDTLGSFVGYMGRAVLHRGRTVGPQQLAPPDPFHPMYELGLTSRDNRCQKFLTWLTDSVKVFTEYSRYKRSLKTDQCPSPVHKMLYHSTTCPTRQPPRQHQYRYVTKLIRKAVASGLLTSHHVTHGTEIGAFGRSGKDSINREVLYNVSKDAMDKALGIMARHGMRKARNVLILLKQSACLGNDDAMFYLAAMLNNGVGVSMDEIQSLAYSMLGTLNAHSLSSMALGFRHSFGLDGAPIDLDISYMYYKTVADKCRKDREEHKDSGYLPEKVRLIDEKLLSLQTSEVEDLFMWLKDQAAKGVKSARADIAELMYWGKQGIQRNLQNALNVYREGAQEGNVQSMYNYGLMQYRGIGGKVNKTEGAEMMKRAAEKKSPDALNALGWIALEVDKNYTEAERLFRLAKGLKHPDGGYYLGHMYMQGHIPNSGVDLDKALENMEWSARKNQIHAGTLYSFLLSRGTPKYNRNIILAVQWARYIAELNGDLGKPLRSAVDSYRHGNLDESLYLYLVLAETGLEVASFNLAYLCEMNTDGVTSYVSKDCQWRQYNLTVQREFKDVDSYSYIKMGDYYWYGCQKTRDLNLAARFYAYAVLKKDPQALFNLAYMVEEGNQIPYDVKSRLSLHGLNSTEALLMELYNRCRKSRKSEAYLPCTLALYRIQAVTWWKEWCQFFNVASLVGVIVSLVVTLFLLYQWIVIKIREIRMRRNAGVRTRRRDSDEGGVEENEDTGGDGEAGRGREREGVNEEGNDLPDGLRLRWEERV